jgi:pSer/pThr/pTyr-binding forkhead associated (FHA) protein
MAKLVILNQGMTGRVHDLQSERTTVGRVEDNAFQIADPSVSSHHCEILLRNGEVVIHDLGSTNGSFINNTQITESVLKPGQTLRLGQVELKLEPAGAPGSAPGPAPAATAPKSPAPPAASKPMDATLVIPRGVSLDQLEQGGRKSGFDTTSTVFKKKRNKTGQYFWIGAGIAIVIIVVLIIVVLSAVRR